jgi:peroxiredoxin Q/BCP
VFGVSFDPPASHDKFKAKYKLPFPLLSDETKKVAKQYGVYKKKSFMGNSYMGIERSTFVIGPDQKIKRIFPKVKVVGHIKEVLNTLK